MPSTSATVMQAEKSRLGKLWRCLDRHYPDPECALVHADPYQLIVATILSAQCTDERVNLTTPALFARYPDVESLAAAASGELERLIHSCGFYRNKARNLIGMAERVVDQHGGQIPRTLEELVELPGVARKTANVVLGTAFGISSGIVVDTHVTRLAARLGLSTASNPEKIEVELMRIVPRPRWIKLSHQLILHGRALCKAQRPRCDACPLAELCPSAATGGQPPQMPSARRPAQASKRKARRRPLRQANESPP